MVPAPTMPTLFTSMIGVSFGTSGIFSTARSPKNAWRSACDSVVTTSSSKRARSNLRPSSKGRFTAASAHATILRGAG
jgi:hypothetical protein